MMEKSTEFRFATTLLKGFQKSYSNRSKTGAALETQTLSIFGTDVLGRGQYTEETIAHELAHQWFGDSIALADWSDIWLNESFATYSQGLWVEYSQGEEALGEWVTEQYNYIAERFDSVTPPSEPTPETLFKNFQLGVTQLQFGSAEDLSFADSTDGAQILLDDDLLAVVSWQTASTFSNNVSQIFVA